MTFTNEEKKFAVDLREATTGLSWKKIAKIIKDKFPVEGYKNFAKVVARVGQRELEQRNANIYTVEEKLDRRRRNNNYEYLVIWSGFGEELNSWEPIANLQNAADLIRNFNGFH